MAHSVHVIGSRLGGESSRAMIIVHIAAFPLSALTAALQKKVKALCQL